MPDSGTHNQLSNASVSSLWQILEEEGIATLILSPEGQLVGLNQPAARLFGGTVAEVLSAGVEGLGLDQDARLGTLLHRDRADGIPMLDIPARRLDGSPIGTRLSTVGANTSDPAVLVRVRRLDDQSDETQWWRREADRYRIALDAAGIGAWDMDLVRNETRRTQLHDACFGYHQPVDSWGYDDFLSHVLEEDRDRVDAAYREAMSGGREYDIEFRVRWPDGSIHWLWSKGQFYLDAEGRPIHVAGLQADVTERRQAEEAHRLATRAIEASTVGVVIVDTKAPDMPMVSVNPAFEEITGYTSEEVLGSNCRFLQGTETDQTALNELRHALAEHADTQVLLRNYRKNGEAFWNRLRVAPIRDTSGDVTHMVGIQTDVSAEIDARNALLKQLSEDTLTGLLNVKAFSEALKSRLAQTDPLASSAALLFIDVDHFKRFNDEFGHPNGDRVLQTVADRIRNALSEDALAARVGGDEFAVVVNGLRNERDAVAKAHELSRAIAEPIDINESRVIASVSIGIALYDRTGLMVEELMRRADAAMYTVKRIGRAGVQLYNPDLYTELAWAAKLEGGLRDAMAANSLTLYYQPKLRLADRSIVGFEALLRWQNKDGTFVLPNDFIPIAERSGLIFDLGDWVIETACRQVRAWLNAGVNTVPVAINISTLQFRRLDIARRIELALRRYDLDGHFLEIEITETAAMEDPENVLETIHYLHSLGVTIAVDDFGTGFSNLRALRQFPFDRLKIDKSFVDGASTNSLDAAICRATIGLAHTFGQKVVAEGVETADTLQFLNAMACDEFQGFLYSPAVPGDAVPTMLAGRRTLENSGAPELMAFQPERHYEPVSADIVRERAIRRLKLDSPAPDDRYDRIVRLAKDLFGTQMAAFSIIIGDRQLFKSRIGLNAASTARCDAFCNHTIAGADPLVIPNAPAHIGFRNNPLVVGEPYIRAYAGVPVFSTDHLCVGALCVLDTVPRDFSSAERSQLVDLAELLEQQLREQEDPRFLRPIMRMGNRRQYSQWFLRIQKTDTATESPHFVVRIGIDGMTEVNRKWGYDEGDICVSRVIDGILSGVGDGCSAYRLSGDQFAVTGLYRSSDEPESIARNIKSAIDRQFLANLGTAPGPTVSIGVARLTRAQENRADIHALDTMATLALSRAKSQGGNCIEEEQNPESGDERAPGRQSG